MLLLVSSFVLHVFLLVYAASRRLPFGFIEVLLVSFSVHPSLALESLLLSPSVPPLLFHWVSVGPHWASWSSLTNWLCFGSLFVFHSGSDNNGFWHLAPLSPIDVIFGVVNVEILKILKILKS